MKVDDLKGILSLHAKWINGEPGGARADLNEANLSGANLSGAKLIRADLIGANLNGANLTRANLINADLSGARLSGANLTGATLSGANLNGAHLEGADLFGADLFGADLSGADLNGADLTKANLTSANLNGADLSRANLTSANLNGADLSRANLIKADLSGADLSGANLTGANLTGATLTGANLSRANLTDADLSRADLSRADLTKADLTNTNLNGADMTNAKPAFAKFFNLANNGWSFLKSIDSGMTKKQEQEEVVIKPITRDEEVERVTLSEVAVAIAAETGAFPEEILKFWERRDRELRQEWEGSPNYDGGDVEWEIDAWANLYWKKYRVAKKQKIFGGRTYIGNAFSLSMIEPDRRVHISKMYDLPYRIQEVIVYGAKSVVGHETTAAMFSRIVGMNIPMCRETVVLEPGDRLIVGQYSGPRLPEGATELPPGANVQWLDVYIEQ